MQTVFLYLPTNVKKHYEVKMNDYLKIKNKTKTCLKLLSSFKLKGRESELCTQNYWSEALLTLNLQFIHSKWQIFLVPLPPSDWQWRQSHFHSSWYFRAFSRGRSEDWLLHVSLPMENVRDLDGDLLLSPKAVFASIMPQCCFCFLQGVWRGWNWSHRGMALQGFGKGGATLLISQKRELG